MNLWSLAASEVVKMTTSVAASDHKLITMMTFLFQWLMNHGKPLQWQPMSIIIPITGKLTVWSTANNKEILKSLHYSPCEGNPKFFGFPPKVPLLQKTISCHNLIESTKTTSMEDVSTGALEKTRTTRTPAFWGYPPLPHDYPHYWPVHFESQVHIIDQFISDPKSKQGEGQISAKFEILEFCYKLNMRHTL